MKNNEKFNEKILKELSQLEISFVYIFGSVAKENNSKESDVDIAFFSLKEYDDFFIFQLAQKISLEINKEVDLIQLKKSSTVFQKEVIEHGKVIFEKDNIERSKFEILVLKKYSRLNEERKNIIENYEVKLW